MINWLRSKLGCNVLANDIAELKSSVNSLAQEIEKLKCSSFSKVKYDEDMQTLSKRIDNELGLVSKAISMLTETNKKFKDELESLKAQKADSPKVKAPSSVKKLK